MSTSLWPLFLPLLLDMEMRRSRARANQGRDISQARKTRGSSQQASIRSTTAYFVISSSNKFKNIAAFWVGRFGHRCLDSDHEQPS